MKYTMSLLLTTALLGTAAADSAKPNAEALQVAQGNNVFALDLYSRLAQEEGNLFFSPYSISNALAMTYAGARGKTAEEMATTLHFGLEPPRLHAGFGDLIKELNAIGAKGKIQLFIANALWGQKGYGFLPEFLKVTESQYGGAMKELDFAGATEQARKTINSWVEGKTKDKIKDLIQQGLLAPDTRLVLTNAIYFKANWLKSFSEKQTYKEDFKVSPGKSVKVDMMHKQETMPYLENDAFQMVELPYDGKDASMIVFLPKKIDGLADFEKSLTSARLDEWLKKAQSRLVHLSLPKFTMTAQFNLKNVLMAMGMKLAFSQTADLSGMTTREKLFIDFVVHKAFVDVNEKGTEAAAATAVGIRPTSAPITLNFRADHPFTFLIRDNHTGSILFMGRLTQPK